MHISTPFELDGMGLVGPACCRTSQTLKLRSTNGWKTWLSGEDFLSNVPQVLVAAGGPPPSAGTGEGAPTGAKAAGHGMTSAGGGAPR